MPIDGNDDSSEINDDSEGNMSSSTGENNNEVGDIMPVDGDDHSSDRNDDDSESDTSSVTGEMIDEDHGVISGNEQANGIDANHICVNNLKTEGAEDHMEGISGIICAGAEKVKETNKDPHRQLSHVSELKKESKDLCILYVGDEKNEDEYNNVSRHISEKHEGGEDDMLCISIKECPGATVTATHVSATSDDIQYDRMISRFVDGVNRECSNNEYASFCGDGCDTQVFLSGPRFVHNKEGEHPYIKGGQQEEPHLGRPPDTCHYPGMRYAC